jgi:hypothetical protein
VGFWGRPAVRERRPQNRMDGPPWRSRGIGANANASCPRREAWGLTQAQRFKHKAHQATSRRTFEDFQKSGCLMFLGEEASVLDAPPSRYGGCWWDFGVVRERRPQNRMDGPPWRRLRALWFVAPARTMGGPIVVRPARALA